MTASNGMVWDSSGTGIRFPGRKPVEQTDEQIVPSSLRNFIACSQKKVKVFFIP